MEGFLESVALQLRGKGMAAHILLESSRNPEAHWIQVKDCISAATQLAGNLWHVPAAVTKKPLLHCPQRVSRETWQLGSLNAQI